MTQPKMGNGQAAKAAARRLFAGAYIINGRNGTQAAITAGYPASTAKVSAHRMLKEPATQKIVDELVASAGMASGLEVLTTLRETARIAMSDPRRFFRADGSPVPVVEWTDDMAAAVAEVEFKTVKVDTVTEGETVTRTETQPGKIKFWNKNDALEKAFRHLGLYERDNRQKAENLTLQVLLVQPGQT